MTINNALSLDDSARSHLLPGARHSPLSGLGMNVICPWRGAKSAARPPLCWPPGAVGVAAGRWPYSRAGLCGAGLALWWNYTQCTVNWERFIGGLSKDTCTRSQVAGSRRAGAGESNGALVSEFNKTGDNSFNCRSHLLPFPVCCHSLSAVIPCLLSLTSRDAGAGAGAGAAEADAFFPGDGAAAGTAGTFCS